MEVWRRELYFNSFSTFIVNTVSSRQFFAADSRGIKLEIFLSRQPIPSIAQ